MNRAFIHCYRLLTGPKVRNLYPQLPAAKCPACSRSEKKVKPGCKHEESRPARCGPNLGKSKSKMPQITALPYFNLWNDLFRLIFLKMLQTFFDPITKDSEKKTQLCFFGDATWEFQLAHSFLVKTRSQKVEKRYDFVTIPKSSGKNWLILTTKTGPKLLWTYDRYNKICPARYYLPPSLLTSIWSTRFNSQDWGGRVIPRCNDASSNVMCQVGPKKTQNSLGVEAPLCPEIFRTSGQHDPNDTYSQVIQHSGLGIWKCPMCFRLWPRLLFKKNIQN